MIKTESKDGIVTLKMDRGKVNALDTDLLQALTESLADAEKDAACRAVVLTGSGATFSAGVDLFRVVKGGKSYLEQFLPVLTDALFTLFTLPKPAVAAVNGHAIAGGCILAAACDTRLMADDTGKIGVPELLVGVPFPSLPLEIMRFVLSGATFARMIYTGYTASARAAHKMGLVDDVVAIDKLTQRSIASAHQLAQIPLAAFHHTKMLMRQPALDRYERNKETLDKEAMKIWCAEETIRCIQSYLAKTIGREA